ncbi:MAG: hypothetical protein QM765_03155 [Myxococcales bacterium]
MPSSRPVGFGEALRRGFGAARHARGVVGLAFLAEAGRDLLSLGVTLSLGGLVLGAFGRTVGRDPLAAFLDPEVAAASFAGQLFQKQTMLPLAGIVVVAALLSVALRLLWVSSGARTFGLSMAGETPPRALAAASHLHRTVPVAALFLPIYAAVMLYGFTAIGSGSLAYFKALESHSGGFGGALSLALSTSLALLLGFFVDMLFQLALVRSVTLDQGPIDAIVGGTRMFARCVPTLVALSFTLGFLQLIAATIAGSGGTVMIGSGAASLALNLYSRALSGLVGSLVLAFLHTAGLGAIAAIDAGDRGVLPDPPPPPPPPAPRLPEKPLETLVVLQAVPVLETQLVALGEGEGEPTPPTAPAQEPVLETQLAPSAEPEPKPAEPVLETVLAEPAKAVEEPPKQAPVDGDKKDEN